MFLKCTFYTPVGIFTGSLNKEDEEEAALIQARDAIERSAAQYIVLFNGEVETCLPENVLANAVAVYSIVETLDAE